MTKYVRVVIFLSPLRVSQAEELYCAVGSICEGSSGLDCADKALRSAIQLEAFRLTFAVESIKWRALLRALIYVQNGSQTTRDAISIIADIRNCISMEILNADARANLSALLKQAVEPWLLSHTGEFHRLVPELERELVDLTVHVIFLLHQLTFSQCGPRGQLCEWSNDVVLEFVSAKWNPSFYPEILDVCGDIVQLISAHSFHALSEIMNFAATKNDIRSMVTIVKLCLKLMSIR